MQSPRCWVFLCRPCQIINSTYWLWRHWNHDFNCLSVSISGLRTVFIVVQSCRATLNLSNAFYFIKIGKTRREKLIFCWHWWNTRTIQCDVFAEVYLPTYIRSETAVPCNLIPNSLTCGVKKASSGVRKIYGLDVHRSTIMNLDGRWMTEDNKSKSIVLCLRELSLVNTKSKALMIGWEWNERKRHEYES